MRPHVTQWCGAPLVLTTPALRAASCPCVTRRTVFYLSYKPPLLGEALPRFAAAAIPWFLLGHLLVSCWMFGNTEALESPSTQVRHGCGGARVGLRSGEEDGGGGGGEGAGG